MRYLTIAVVMALAGCLEVTTAPSAPATAPATDVAARGISQSTFRIVASRVIPVAERECARRTDNISCDYIVGLDTNRNQPPNAYQTIGSDGRPRVVFNTALLADLNNTDELAFIIGHEAAHHIRLHLQRMNQSATTGAILGGVLASVLGADVGAIDTAQRAGAVVGARRYSKEFELEADALGTVIAHNAGYDPVRGAAYFTRIADPGNQFLGSHPPNADRIKTVRRVAAGL